MALKDGFPSASGLADALDLRLALAGTVVHDSAGNPRSGVFPRSTTALVTATATMNSSIAAAEFAVSRTGQGVILLANDGPTNVLHDAAPVANSRYDIIYVKQNDAVSPNADASNLPAFGILKGTASASPTLPTYAAAKAAVPAGAEPLAAVLIPSTATSMQSAGVTYTQIHQYTAMSGGSVWVRNATERDASGWTRGQDVFLLDSLTTSRYDGNIWGGPGRGSRAVFYTPTPEALHAISTDSFGDLAYIETSSGVYGSWWGYDGGSGRWRPLGRLMGATKAQMDTFIAAVAAQASLAFAPGLDWFNADTGITYTFTTSAGDYLPRYTEVFHDAAATILSSSLAPLPAGLGTTLVTAACRARITLQFYGTCTAGTLEVGIAVSGATTIGADQGPTSATGRNGTLATVFSAAAASYTISKIVNLNAGSNVFTAVARLGGAGGTKVVANPVMTIEII